jgi:hypothetical protein
MPPPIHITGAPFVDWIIFIVGAVVCIYWLRALRLAREGARLFLRSLLKAVVVFCISMVILAALRFHSHLLPPQEQIFSAIVAFMFFGRWRWQYKHKRSRHIPKAVRLAVIERDLRGERLDPQRHHIDHVWPYAKGGSHTPDNLRVIEKRRNLQKGARRPRMKEMW